ncbi:DUF7507 domain-containing protein [Arthrobacter sp. H14-L1]|uniref:DUF7507 domain-containing protein n=1 Tax=Arthrobacter sp. H14-L1 TaxID=2996697 RepID=UPI003B64053E
MGVRVRFSISWTKNHTGEGGTTATGSASATVTITAPAPTTPSITVSKSASPTSLPAPGGAFTYTATVANTGTTDVTLTTLTDSISGNLNGQGTCASGGTIAAGASYSCRFTRTFTGAAGASETDTASATVAGAGGTTATGSASATVTITAPAPTTGVLKICKKADNYNGTVSGSYTFTVGTKSVTVPVGSLGCGIGPQALLRNLPSRASAGYPEVTWRRFMQIASDCPPSMSRMMSRRVLTSVAAGSARPLTRGGGVLFIEARNRQHPTLLLHFTLEFHAEQPSQPIALRHFPP